MSSDRLHQRLRELRARLTIRKWEMRQIDHAGGVWFRLQRLLASTRRALIITTEETAAMRAAGFESHAVGRELEPPKELFVIAEDSIPPEVRGREIPLYEAREILCASAMILIPFDSE